MINKIQIGEIAGDLIKGKRCYIHTISNDIISVLNKPDEELDMQDAISYKKVQADIDNYKEVLPPSSTLGFKMMESFTASVEDFEKQSYLMETLSFEQPFANFKKKVYELKMNNEWHSYQMNAYKEVVQKQL